MYNFCQAIMTAKSESGTTDVSKLDLFACSLPSSRYLDLYCTYGGESRRMIESLTRSTSLYLHQRRSVRGISLRCTAKVARVIPSTTLFPRGVCRQVCFSRKSRATTSTVMASLQRYVLIFFIIDKFQYVLSIYYYDFTKRESYLNTSLIIRFHYEPYFSLD